MQEDPPSRSWTSASWRALLRVHRRRLLRLRERLRFSEEAFHLILAGVVGVVGGLVNITLYYAAELAKRTVFNGDGTWTELAAGASPWLRLLLPVGGAFLAGWILHWSARVARLPDTGNILEVVVVGDGRLHLRSALAKALSSLITITSGGSIGREGPITHLSATLASRLGMAAGWHPYRLRLLVACGTAAGMAAAYNAPVAGAVFAAQIVLGSFSMTLFAPLVFSSVIATMISRSVFGLRPIYSLPPDFEFSQMSQLPWFLVLGLLAGALGAVFMRLLHETSSWFKSRFPHMAVRLAAGGVFVGLIAVSLPEVWGNGYGPTNTILHDGYGLRFLVLLLVGKLAATIITVGTGAVGGVFTPTLFLGAALGGVFGEVLHHYGTAQEISSTAFALVGMGCTLAATTHSVLLAVIMVFEISLNHTLFPPLLVACAIATLSARRFWRDDIYTGPLRRRGLLLEREAARLGVTAQKSVGDLMQKPIRPVLTSTAFRTVADRFLASPLNYLPVVDTDGKLVGMVALQDLKLYLGVAGDLESVIAFDVMRPPPRCLTPDQRFLDALPLLLASELRNVPVVDTLQDMKLVGAINRPEALGMLSEAIGTRSTHT